ncbi:MAG: hypothetical protein GY928_38500 [Colwellia sp.]|nr:hypothetical protein [Colwellia sp.]
MRIILINFFVAILLLTNVALSKANKRYDIEAQLKFSVESKAINSVPNHIDIIVSNPKKYLRSQLKIGNIHQTNIPNTVRIYNTLVSFFKPSEYPTHDVGDIIYIFLLESKQVENNFIDMHNLQVRTFREGYGGFKHTEYVYKLGHYVILQVKTKVYVCKVHPEIFKNEKGKCGECGKKLIEEDVYR